jgi:hypothetical protein
LKNVKFHTLTKMYNAVDVSILEYGCGVCGYTKTAYSESNSQCVLEVHNFTPTAAL